MFDHDARTRFPELNFAGLSLEMSVSSQIVYFSSSKYTKRSQISKRNVKQLE